MKAKWRFLLKVIEWCWRELHQRKWSNLLTKWRPWKKNNTVDVRAVTCRLCNVAAICFRHLCFKNNAALPNIVVWHLFRASATLPSRQISSFPASINICRHRNAFLQERTRHQICFVVERFLFRSSLTHFDGPPSIMSFDSMLFAWENASKRRITFAARVTKQKLPPDTNTASN